MPSVTLEFQSPYDVCARCGRERRAHGQYGNEACGLFTKKEAPVAYSPGPWKSAIYTTDQGEPFRSDRIIDAPGDVVLEAVVDAGFGVLDFSTDANKAIVLAAPELAAALRKVTANLRGRVERGLERFTQASVDIDLADEGVIEAEALLKRIDES